MVRNRERDKDESTGRRTAPPTRDASPPEQGAAVRPSHTTLESDYEYYRDVFENSPDMIVSVSAEDKTIIRCNQTVVEVLGFSKDEVIGRPVVDFYARECLADVQLAMQSFTTHGFVRDAHLILRRKDGKTIPVTLNVTAMRDENGKILYSRSIWRDATQGDRIIEESRRRNATLLSANVNLRSRYQSAEVMFRSLFTHAGMGITIVSPAGKILEVNPALEEILGYSSEELRAVSFEDITHPDDIDLDTEFYAELMSGQRTSYRVTKRYYHSTGRLIYARLTVSLIRTPTGDIQHVVGMFEDVTERQEAQLRLQESRRRFELAAEGSADGIWDVNLETGALVASGRMAEMLGLDQDEMPESIEELLDLVHELDREQVEETIGRLREPGRRFSVDCRFRFAGGEYRWRQMRGGIVEVAADESFRMVGVLSDIALRKRTENQLHNLNVQLERRVRQRTRALEQANKELEAFSYSVSHDLRAPLRALDGFSQLLLEDYADALDATGRDFLNRIRGAAQSMGALIDDILRLSRVTRMELTIVNIDLSRMARELAQNLHAQEPDRAIEWKIQPGIAVRGDERLIRIVLTNLLENAMKYSRPRKPAIIEVGMELHEDALRCFVRDNGVGFDHRYAKKLFKAFQRLHNKADFEGSGIGLATVARIINRHGGEVSALSEPDKGAAFYFTLNCEAE